MEKSSTVTNFEFTIFASNRSRSHIAVEDRAVCGEDGANMESRTPVTFDGERFVSNDQHREIVLESLEHVVDCKKCLRWFRENVQE